MFIDPGSNLNFILKSLARDLELEGTPTEIQLKVVDDEFRQRPVMIYRMAVVDRGGTQHVMEAVGVDTITESQPIPDPEAVRAAFPGVPEEVLSRPVGRVGLLLGMTERHLHAEGGKSVGKLWPFWVFWEVLFFPFW